MKNSHKLIELLIKNKLHICCAESCTGGMLTSSLVDVANASGAVDIGFVTYANSAKVKFLGVSEKSIEKYGVVSETVAKEMAEGAARVSGADIGVGISGIAGPSGGSENKPIGTVCFGFCINGNSFAATVNFGNIGRQNVREKSCEYAIDTLIKNIAE